MESEPVEMDSDGTYKYVERAPTKGELYGLRWKPAGLILGV
jgi:hypothetical protein